MKTTKLLFILLLGLFIMSLGALALDGTVTAITFTTPLASASIGTTYTFGGAYTGNSTGNITVYNGTYDSNSVLCSDSTLTTDGSTWTCDATLVAGMDDCTGHTIYAIYYNGTEGGNANNTLNQTQTGVIFDSTVPTITSVVFGRSEIMSEDRITYTHTATDVCDSSLTYSFPVTNPKSTVVVTETASSGTVDKRYTKLVGTYTSSLTVTDDAGNTATDATGTFRVTAKRDGVAYGLEEDAVIEKAKEVSSRNLLAGGILLFIVAIFVLVLIMHQVNKK